MEITLIFITDGVPEQRLKFKIHESRDVKDIIKEVDLWLPKVVPDSVKFGSFWLLKNGVKLNVASSLQDSKVISDSLIYIMLELA